MKKILVSVIICMFVVVLFSVTAKAQSPIIGTWKTIIIVKYNNVCTVCINL
jgi:hypothetical protein